ncbi:MAG: hypothetical protein ACUVWR_15540 [Anaerolineae bacterium]
MMRLRVGWYDGGAGNSHAASSRESRHSEHSPISQSSRLLIASTR